ncbi:MAG: NAD(P)/FAD-dependent oxidoreductase [Nocardioidaceae bacterium]|nr:NAD(P)/FAD-dependent oxidoreductase [Nocardioidaceae bacterium]
MSGPGAGTAAQADHDAVVIGAGPNGLVAANLLADAGWDVLVLEAQPTIGGAVHSDSAVHEGYIHDTFSSFYPLTACSPTIQGLHLERHGLVWRQAPAVVGTPFDDGSWVMLDHDPGVTAAGLDRHAAGDGDTWLDMVATWRKVAPSLIGALLTPFPPVKHGLGLLARLPRVGGLSFVQLLVSSAQSLAGQFRSEPARVLLSGSAAHADIPPSAPGSGLMGWLLCMLGQEVGWPVPEGGAGRLAAALGDRFVSQGGDIRCSTRVRRVLVRDGRAMGVETDDGEVVTVRHAVIADVVAPRLYGDLVAWEHLPAKLRVRMQHFEWDPGTVKVDWALDRPIPWVSAPDRAPGTVHITESMEHAAVTSAQISSGAVPAEPLLLLGQMTTADATRSPAGTESAWAYTHVPQKVRADAGGDGIRGVWDSDDSERMADRMQARVERYAPGLADRIVARRVLGPLDLQARDENLVSGSINGGTSSLYQQLIFRPVPGLGRAETPVKGLYLGSASAHPGGGVHGAPGSNAARAALGHACLRRLR